MCSSVVPAARQASLEGTLAGVEARLTALGELSSGIGVVLVAAVGAQVLGVLAGRAVADGRRPRVGPVHAGESDLGTAWESHSTELARAGPVVRTVPCLEPESAVASR